MRTRRHRAGGGVPSAWSASAAVTPTAAESVAPSTAMPVAAAAEPTFAPRAMKFVSRGAAPLVAVFAAIVFAPSFSGCTDDPARAETIAPTKTAAPVQPRATLTQMQGEVTVKRAAGDEWIAATDKMELFENDKLRTARGASVLVRFRSGSALTVGEDALVGIAESTRPGTDASDITVLKGRIDAELSNTKSQSLVVSTPSATVRAGREIVFQ